MPHRIAIVLVLAMVVGTGCSPTIPYSPTDFAVTRLGAERGDRGDQFRLGLMYDLGKGAPQNYDEAWIWYYLAAEQGHAVAQHNLGVMYYNGEGVAQDYAEAAKWYHRAAVQGFAPAQRQLGEMYEKGEGVPQNSAKASQWVRQSMR